MKKESKSTKFTHPLTRACTHIDTWTQNNSIFMSRWLLDGQDIFNSQKKKLCHLELQMPIYVGTTDDTYLFCHFILFYFIIEVLHNFDAWSMIIIGSFIYVRISVNQQCLANHDLVNASFILSPHSIGY